MAFRELLDQLFNALHRSNMRVEIQSSMQAYMKALFGATGKRLGNPELDPRLHDFGPQEAFWVRIADRNDETVAIMACRRITAETPDDFRDLVNSYRIWFGNRIIVNERIDCVAAGDVPIPSGTIAFGTGM